MAVIDRTKLLPPGRPGTPEGEVVQQGTPAGYMSEQQYNSLNRNIFAIRSNLKAIADLLNNKALEEKEEDRKEIEQERVRQDKLQKDRSENFIESSIKNALIKPVQTLQKQSRGVFASLFDAIKSLFVGWLGVKGMEALEAWRTGDNQKLEELKGSVIQGLAIAAGVGAAITFGIPLVTGAIGGLVSLIISSLPAIFALLANPYIWLGAGVFFGGYKLWQLFGDAKAKSSYSAAKQKTITDIQTRGIKPVYDDLAAELAEKEQELAKNPLNFMLRNEVDEIKQQMKLIKDGTWAHFDGQFMDSKLGYTDRKGFLNVDSKLVEIRQTVVADRDFEKKLNDLTGGQDPSTLSTSDKEQYDQLIADRRKNRTNFNKMMDELKSIRDSLTENGQANLNAKFQESGIDFKAGAQFLWQNVPFSGYEMPQLNFIDRARNKLEPVVQSAGQGPAGGPVQGLPMDRDNIRDSSHEDLTNMFLSEVRTLKRSARIDRAVQLSFKPRKKPSVQIVPIDSEKQPQDKPVPITDPGTPKGAPSIMTSNPNNAYLDFAVATYGVE